MEVPTSYTFQKNLFKYTENSKIIKLYKVPSIRRVLKVRGRQPHCLKKSKTDINVTQFNNICPKLKFALEQEESNKINILELRCLDSTIIYNSPIFKTNHGGQHNF
jgi:hypothetical protein